MNFLVWVISILLAGKGMTGEWLATFIMVVFLLSCPLLAYVWARGRNRSDDK